MFSAVFNEYHFVISIVLAFLTTIVVWCTYPPVIKGVEFLLIEDVDMFPMRTGKRISLIKNGVFFVSLIASSGFFFSTIIVYDQILFDSMKLYQDNKINIVFYLGEILVLLLTFVFYTVVYSNSQMTISQNELQIALKFHHKMPEKLPKLHSASTYRDYVYITEKYVTYTKQRCNEACRECFKSAMDI